MLRSFSAPVRGIIKSSNYLEFQFFPMKKTLDQKFSPDFLIFSKFPPRKNPISKKFSRKKNSIFQNYTSKKILFFQNFFAPKKIGGSKFFRQKISIFKIFPSKKNRFFKFFRRKNLIFQKLSGEAKFSKKIRRNF